MTEQEKKEILDSVMDSVQEKVDAAIKAGMEQIETKFDEQNKANEEIVASFEAATKALADSKAELQASVDSAIELLKQEAEKKEALEAEAEAEAEKQDEVEVKPMEASAEVKDIPAPTAMQSVVPNPIVSAADEKAQKMNEIQASSMTGIEKIRAITKLRFE